jgi:hypothetical protein
MSGIRGDRHGARHQFCHDFGQPNTHIHQPSPGSRPENKSCVITRKVGGFWHNWNNPEIRFLTRATPYQSPRFRVEAITRPEVLLEPTYIHPIPTYSTLVGGVDLKPGRKSSHRDAIRGCLHARESFQQPLEESSQPLAFFFFWIVVE